MIRVYFVLIVIIPATFSLFAQQPATDTTKREAVVRYIMDDNKVDYSVITPPLQQIPGAPKAFYNFYWELGDGNYSLEPEPKHVYRKEGDYTVRVWTTNNYDNGKPPPSRPQKVQVKKISYEYKAPAVLPDAEIFDIKNNREPVPDEEMVVIVSYKNETGLPANGRLHVFYNEKKFKANNFTLQEVRTHHGERTITDEPVTVASVSPVNPHALWASALPGAVSQTSNHLTTVDHERPLNEELEASRSDFRNAHIIEFDNMEAGESRNIFFSFRTTPEMLKDTSAVVKIKGVYVPDRSTTGYTKKELEMEIVTSHDPNKMSVSDTRLNYRRYKNKVLDFKVRFQNNGEGPARSIKLDIDVPEMYDKRTLTLLDMYPPCPVCPDGPAQENLTHACIDTLFTDGKIIFHFRNIYLPGSNQKNIEDYDSTKGFVKYSLRFNPDAEKKKTVSRTAIIFDKNEPVITNYATTRFKPGLSIGAMAGYNGFPDLFQSKSFFFGATLSPYKSLNGYWQVEVMGESHAFDDQDSTYNETRTLTDGAIGLYDVYETALKTSYKNIRLTIVPASYRYSINNFIGIGGGIQLTTVLHGSVKQRGVARYSLLIEQQNRMQRDPERDVTIDRERPAESLSSVDAGLFGDVTLGSSRIGPTLGARYVYHFEAPHVQYQFYACWKF